MDKALQDIVTAIAWEVRLWAEGYARFGDQDDLNGLCAITSAELYRRLEKAGIVSEIHMWTWDLDESAHVYCVVDDHVVDVTATQFKQFRDTKVVIMHCKEAEAYDFYQTKEVFETVEQLRKQQKKALWPSDQVALPA